MRVKNLPVDAKPAFQVMEGALPNVAFMGGTFYSVVWRPAPGWPEAEWIPRDPGDWLVEDPNYGISIVASEEVCFSDSS